MMLLAEISTMGLLALSLLGAWFVLRAFGGAARRHQPMVWKVLSLTAVGVGLWVFLVRGGGHAPESFEFSDYSQPDVAVETGADVRTHAPVLRATRQSPREFQRTAQSIPRWSIIVLGSLLVILGALVFGREKTRPGAFKLATFLGIGAIVYLVATFFGDPPRLSHPGKTEVRRELAVAEEIHVESPRYTGHARRPQLRPRRPLADQPTVQPTLPPRAGEIPVSAELAQTPESKQPVSATSAPEAVAPQAAAPQAAATPVTPPAESAVASTPEASASAPPDANAADAKPVEAKAVETQPAAPQPEVKQPAVTGPVVVVSEAKPEIKEPTVVVTVPRPVVAHANEPRPDWVDAPARLNQGGIYTMPIRSGLFVSVPECQRELDAEVNTAVAHYIDEYLADLSDHASSLVDLSLPYLKKHVVKAEYAEVVESESVGPMHQVHARLEFDDQVRADVRRRLHDRVVEQRLWYAGGGAALVLALLATMYGYLKLDLWAGEGARARLQLAATLVALVATAGVLLARYAVHF